MQTCCKTPRNDLFVVDPRDKSCAHPDAKPFNSYLLNRLQNPRENFTVDFSDPIVQRTLIEDAVSCIALIKTILINHLLFKCFVDCYT
jgi:hypothetical protein